MPSNELIRNFQEKNNVQIDSENIRITIDRILTVNADNKVREARIGEYILSVYPQIADEYERNRVQASVENTGNVAKSTALEFFEEYVNIISQIVKESSDSLAAQAVEEAEKAKKNLEAAEQKYQNEVDKYETAQFNVSIGTNVNMEQYKTNLENAQIALASAKEKNDNAVSFNPYESSMDYFGISGLNALKMLNNQLNTYNYMDMRRAQIESSGVTSPVYITELYSAFPPKTTYQSASADDKRKMQEVYATKQIMQEKLDSKQGLSGWFWKLTHRAETKAMKNYIASANGALLATGFDEAAKAEAIDAMSERGYFSGEYTSSTLDAVNEKFAENEKIYAPIRDNKTEIKIISEMPIKDQLFEIKFRPSKNVKTLNEQNQAYKEIKKFVENNKNIPEDVIKVFEANRKKLRSVMGLYTRSQSVGPQEMDRRDDICEKIEAELMMQVSHDNYKPMKFDEIKALNTQKEPMKVDFNDKNVKEEFSQPVSENDLVKKNEGISIN